MKNLKFKNEEITTLQQSAVCKLDPGQIIIAFIGGDHENTYKQKY